MDIKEIICKEAIMVKVEVSSKKQLLEMMAKIAANSYGLDEIAVADVIQEREKLGSTGVGNGIAIPHGRIGNILHPVGVLVTLKTPIDFDAIDKEPINIACMLLAPENAGADHLNALSCISKILKDDEKCKAIRTAKTPEEVYEIIGTA